MQQNYLVLRFYLEIGFETQIKPESRRFDKH